MDVASTAPPEVSPTTVRRRRALVTGVGRRAGIATTIAERLVADGWQVGASGWRPYDARMPSTPAG